MTKRRGLQVLVVDGEESGERLARFLRSAGHETDVVHDGGAAVAVAQAKKPDVIFLETELPGGEDVARSLRDQSAWRRPFLIAHSRTEQPDCPQRDGIDLHLAKPADPDWLLGLLRRFQGIVDDYESFDPVI